MKSPTGRLNQTMPDVQHYPGTPEYKAAQELRAKFRAAYPNLLVEFDFTNAELMALAAARVPHKDIHVETATKMFGVTADEVTPAMRNAAKKRNYWDLYGTASTTRYLVGQEDDGETD